MAGRALDAGLAHASHLLAKCEFLLRHFDGERENAELLADARRCCDEAEEEAVRGDVETAATIAILRSMAATLSLRHTVLFNVNCDFDDDDGTLLNGMEEHDEECVSRPPAEQAVQAARAALNADPEDPLVPLYLGHALTWSGDRDGAVAAYEEAMRRDPRDGCAQSSLQYLEAEPNSRPTPNEMSRGRHGFALLRGCFWISNNDSDSESLLFGSVADARAHVDRRLSTYLTEDDLEDEGAELVLQVHRPGRQIIEYDLNAQMQQESDEEPLRIDWAGIPVHEPLKSPYPPGRPLRIGGHTCFYGGSE
ncbi:tetratricopeptide repeat protein [Streptomyces sp. KR80]|uniref:tetratricopeptide repeat protein n=1 Tax=Streptomyces sp. KR80 TaxID=3457426 RepID=UPI003FD34CBE